MIKNRVDKDAGITDQEGDKYSENTKDLDGGIDGAKELEPVKKD